MNRLTTLIVVLICLAHPPLAAAALDVAAIAKAAGADGTWFEQEKVYKLTFPREDVKVTVEGVSLPPFMGLTTWASFTAGQEGKVMLMGDVVLLADEVNPAMSAALDAGLEVTALHNHFFYDEPRVYFMHLGGEGTATQLASGVRKVLDTVRQLRAKTPQPATSFGGRKLPAASAVTAAPLDAIFAARGQAKDGMYKIVFGREVSMPCACIAGKEMGVNTWAAFYGSDEHALVDGDFACTYAELQPVLRTLRKHQINVVAIHNHMAAEAPRLIFLHYQATGRAADLAKAVKAALDAARKPHDAHQHHNH